MFFNYAFFFGSLTIKLYVKHKNIKNHKKIYKWNYDLTVLTQNQSSCQLCIESKFATTSQNIYEHFIAWCDELQNIFIGF